MNYAIRLALIWILIGLVWGMYDPADAQVVINELMADPASDWNGDGTYQFRDDEWVEILNTGAEMVNLSGLFLRDITDETPHLQLSGQLEPGETRVFFGSEAAAWQEAADITVTGFSLNNTGDTVELVTSDGTSYFVLDSVTFLDHEAEDDRSSGRDPDTGMWLLYDGLNPHSGSQEPPGTGCTPTPGEVNFCDPEVPIDSATWDEVKSLYQ